VDTTAERVGKNDATFREANERIQRAARDLAVEPVPFICECADPACTELVQMSLAEYEGVRADSRHFLNTPGHEVNADGYGRVVSHHDAYVVVEKLGDAAKIVEELDPRKEVAT
jgi:hypothetical protein